MYIAGDALKDRIGFVKLEGPAKFAINVEATEIRSLCLCMSHK